MKEVKNPKKPLLYYYVVIIAGIFLLNSLILPNIAENSIKDVDYGTFMTMTEACKVSEVEVQDNQIVFTDKGNVIYRTGLMNDPDLTER